MNRHQEERQLLEMQADILRLKIAAAHLRNRRETPAASHFFNLLPTHPAAGLGPSCRRRPGRG